MPDEKDYESYLVSYEDAMKRLRGTQRVIVDRAYKWWRKTEEWLEEELVECVAKLGEGPTARDQPGRAGSEGQEQSGYRSSIH